MVNSKKVLSLLLASTLFVVVALVFVSLSMLDSFGITGYLIEGHGALNLSIAPTISITTGEGDHIDFGNCKLLGYNMIITSDGLFDTFDSCSNYEIMNISLRNDGNIPLTILLSSDAVGASHNGSFLESPSNSSEIAYKVTNIGRLGNQGGCTGELGPVHYTPIENVSDEYLICDYLIPGPMGGFNSVVSDFKIVVPYDADVGNVNVTLTFIAMDAS